MERKKPAINPYAFYVNCDGAMDYAPDNPGGIGFVITFPESVGLEPIEISKGRYTGGNIEKLELEALIQAMKEMLIVYEKYSTKLKNIGNMIFVTDRYGLREDGKTSYYKIREWRKQKWKNHEGKPIKNHKLLNELDKARYKLSKKTYATITIQYQRRKFNKAADKLGKAGKTSQVTDTKLKNKIEKIGTHKFNGPEIDYSFLKPDTSLHIHIYKKEPVQNEWEVSADICSGSYLHQSVKIYVSNEVEPLLKRRNEFIVKIMQVYQHHIRILPKIKPFSGED